ncbi:MAG: squalene/phytoene synthase family protein [Candidatus Rokubacteria bacterium]|nr:squalene/phytoene synthase family protein [Candidatus Rokubacteria bacterium]
MLGDVLKRVSRSFYLSLAILPRDLREPIGLAYLLARAADTVADTRLIARAERLSRLETLRRAYRGEAADVTAAARACAPLQSQAAERILLERVGEGVARLEALEAGDRTRVRAVLATLTSGMVFDLTRFPGDDARHIAALDTEEELDHYTYLVAGCVGDFWTRMHAAHRPRLAHWDVDAMSRAGVRFGKALQMTNVLRDVPHDLAGGRCYLPAHDLAALGVSPADLLTRDGAERARPLYTRLLGVALGHYDVGWHYTLAIPRREARMRLACAWPLLIGLGTLAELSAHPSPLTARTSIKLSRAAVRGILARSALSVWSNRALARHAARLRTRISV